MDREKMFRVIVLGGVALIGPSSCAIAVSPIDPDAATDQDSAPRDAADVLPFTSPVVDSGGFPRTQPAMPDAGTDADADAGTCMPSETPFRSDC